MTARVEIVSERCQNKRCLHSVRHAREGQYADVDRGELICGKCGWRSLVVVEVHHAKCADPLRLGCQCPASWPRRPGEEHVKHVKGGNCWAGVRGGDACLVHDEPRGECSVCPRCPACDLEAP